MYEKMETKRMELELERIKFERERNNAEMRYRCLDLAKIMSCDNATLLQEAQKIMDFIEGK